MVKKEMRELVRLVRLPFLTTLSLTQAAKICGVSQRTIKRWVPESRKSAFKGRERQIFLMHIIDAPIYSMGKAREILGITRNVFRRMVARKQIHLTIMPAVDKYLDIPTDVATRRITLRELVRVFQEEM